MSVVPNLHQTDNSIDDGVDTDIYACLDLTSPKSFFLYAGAGSGKTRSLVNAIDRVRVESRNQLRLNGQRIAVITYTNAASDEIKRRLEFDPLVQVSTIHSFAWSLINGYNDDIRDWLRINLTAEISELQAAAAKGRAGTQAAIDRERSIESKKRRLGLIENIRKFVYSPTGENKTRDSLNHAEVIGITSNFLAKKLVLAKVLVSRFPILFIDESQDTNKHLMDAFLVVQKLHSDRFCLGLFGDTMQRIYSDGKVKLEEAIPESWAKPAKKMNHRCPKRVIRLINRIRSAVDAHEQVGRAEKPDGLVRLFVLPISTLDVAAHEIEIARQMAIAANDSGWTSGLGAYQTLVLEHQMAARRMGFEAMFAALYKSARLKTSLMDGSLSGVRLFTDDVLPLVTAMRQKDSFAVAEAVRKRSPLLNSKLLASLDSGQIAQLKKAQAGADALIKLWDCDASPSFQDVLDSVAESKLFSIPIVLESFINNNLDGSLAPMLVEPVDDEDSTEQDKELAAWREFLLTPFDQISAYAEYINGASRYATHQGVKGLQFPRVMVIASDDEAKGFLFSYEKFFGAKAKSTTDLAHETNGDETTIDKTRRLFYVTCSRAESSLAIVAYSQNPVAVKLQAIKEGWFEEAEIVTLQN